MSKARKWTRKRVSDWTEVVGAGAVSYGVWHWSQALGWIVGGGFILLFSFLGGQA